MSDTDREYEMNLDNLLYKNQGEEKVMNKTQITKQITNYYRISQSFDWSIKLLKEQKDQKNITKIESIKSFYNEKMMELVKQIGTVTIYPKRDVKLTFTYSIDQSLINKNLQKGKNDENN